MDGAIRVSEQDIADYLASVRVEPQSVPPVPSRPKKKICRSRGASWF
jgi:hypothetical protein